MGHGFVGAGMGPVHGGSAGDVVAGTGTGNSCLGLWHHHGGDASVGGLVVGVANEGVWALLGDGCRVLVQSDRRNRVLILLNKTTSQVTSC